MNQRAWILGACLVVGGCASGLNSHQERQMANWESIGYSVEEKDPTLAAWLGILPGVGSFYVGEVGYGIVNLLFWPLSVCWDPVSGHNGAMTRNYNSTQALVKYERNRELDAVDRQLTRGEITAAEHDREVARIDRTYGLTYGI